MKGYVVPFGYRGFIPNPNGKGGEYMLFATESEYAEIYNDLMRLRV